MKKLLIATALSSVLLNFAHAEKLFELKDQYLSETMPQKVGKAGPMILKNYQVGKVKVETNLSLWGEEGVYGTIEKSDAGYLKVESDAALAKWRFEVDAKYGFYKSCGNSTNAGKNHLINFYSDNNEKFSLEINDCFVRTEKVAKTATEKNSRNTKYTIEYDGTDITVSQNSVELFSFEKGAFGKLKTIDMGVGYPWDYTKIYNIKLTSK